MVERWTDANYKLDEKCRSKLGALESEYTEKYGPLPEWRFINDVWKTMHQLREELDG